MNISGKVVAAVVVLLLAGPGCTSTAELAQEREKTRQAVARAAEAEQKLMELVQDMEGGCKLVDGIDILKRKNEKLVQERDMLIEAHDADVRALMDKIEALQIILERAQVQLNVQIATVLRLQEMSEEYRTSAERAIARAAEAEQKLMEMLDERGDKPDKDK